MARLGVIIDGPNRRITRLKPSSNEYDDLLVIRTEDLPSGPHRPYLIIIQGMVGEFLQSSWTVDTVTRFGLRIRLGSNSSELVQSWSTISRRDSPLTQGNRFAIPFQIVYFVPSWGEPAREFALSGHQLIVGAGTLSSATAQFDNLIAIVIDATALGGAPTAFSGWDGPRLRVVNRISPVHLLSDFPFGLLLTDLGPLPWTSGTQKWLIAWSEQVHLKDNISSLGFPRPAWIWAEWPLGTKRCVWAAQYQNLDVGTPGNFDGRQIQQIGGWSVVTVDGPAVAPRSYGASTNDIKYSTAQRGSIIALRVDNLDGFHYEEDLTLIAEGFGKQPGVVVREYTSTTPVNRDLPRLLAMSVQNLPHSRILTGYPSAFGVTANQNRHQQFSRNPAQQLYSYSRISNLERQPVFSALVTPPTHPAIEASAAYYDWHVNPLVPLHPTSFLEARDRQFLALSLSDDGPIIDPPDPVYTDIQIHPGYEVADFGELPPLPPGAEPALPLDEPARVEMIAADKSVSTWGAHTTPGRVYPLSWVGTRANGNALLIHMEALRTFRWTPPLEDPPVEIAILVTNLQLIHESNSISRVTAVGIQLLYFAP